jgi:hypothetical protein
MKKTIELCGADRWAKEWARERQVPYLGMPARWAAEGNGACATGAWRPYLAWAASWGCLEGMMVLRHASFVRVPLLLFFITSILAPVGGPCRRHERP